MNVVENESVTLAAVSRQEKFDFSRIEEKFDSRTIVETGSNGGLAVRLTPVRLETWILFLAFFIVAIR